MLKVKLARQKLKLKSRRMIAKSSKTVAKSSIERQKQSLYAEADLKAQCFWWNYRFLCISTGNCILNEL